MAIWIWRWRRTMLERARWIALTAFRRFENSATMSRKCRMLISGQAQGAWKACGPIRTPSARMSIRAAGSFLRTTRALRTIKASQAAEFSPAGQFVEVEGAFQNSGTRKAGVVGGQKFFHQGFAPVSPVFLAAGIVFTCPPVSPSAGSGQADSGVARSSPRSETDNT